jgi:hypothetical protein
MQFRRERFRDRTVVALPVSKEIEQPTLAVNHKTRDKPIKWIVLVGYFYNGLGAFLGR